MTLKEIFSTKAGPSAGQPPYLVRHHVYGILVGISEMGNPWGFTEDHMRSIFTNMDVNGDGKVSFEELIKAYCVKPERWKNTRKHQQTRNLKTEHKDKRTWPSLLSHPEWLFQLQKTSLGTSGTFLTVYFGKMETKRWKCAESSFGVFLCSLFTEERSLTFAQQTERIDLHQANNTGLNPAWCRGQQRTRLQSVSPNTGTFRFWRMVLACVWTPSLDLKKISWKLHGLKWNSLRPPLRDRLPERSEGYNSTHWSPSPKNKNMLSPKAQLVLSCCKKICQVTSEVYFTGSVSLFYSHDVHPPSKHGD